MEYPTDEEMREMARQENRNKVITAIQDDEMSYIDIEFKNGDTASIFGTERIHLYTEQFCILLDGVVFDGTSQSRLIVRNGNTNGQILSIYYCDILRVNAY